ncbi:MAG: DUF2608 domain-containing protein [Deltaproteobacteria bacterium]|nr:DUF2608 domain-containing protein [Deltaproteobacteria bacterium]MBI3293201.1 DUF2608 domain-containing protein [Deltaproteobacteria bacterium]
MKTTKLTVLMAAALAITAQATIRETNSLRDVANAATTGSFVAFDLDNTLIEPIQTLGSDQWFEHISKQLGIDGAIALWSKVQLKTQVRPVEQTTSSIVREIQDRGVPVIGLTARPLTVAEATLQQLASVGIDLSRTTPIFDDLAFPGHLENAQYTQGIIFAGKNQKGDMIVRFLDRTGLHPSVIVFADDKPKHTASVDSALTAKGINNIEFRYGAADERVKAFDAEIAAVQLHYFDGILDDEAAATLSNR